MNDSRRRSARFHRAPSPRGGAGVSGDPGFCGDPGFSGGAGFSLRDETPGAAPSAAARAAAQTEVCATTTGNPAAQTEVCATTTGNPAAQTEVCATTSGNPAAQTEVCATTSGNPAAQTEVCATTSGNPAAQTEVCATPRAPAKPARARLRLAASLLLALGLARPALPAPAGAGASVPPERYHSLKARELGGARRLDASRSVFSGSVFGGVPNYNRTEEATESTPVVRPYVAPHTTALELRSVLAGNSLPEDGVIYDINRDGKTDIIDLVMLEASVPFSVNRINGITDDINHDYNITVMNGDSKSHYFTVSALDANGNLLTNLDKTPVRVIENVNARGSIQKSLLELFPNVQLDNIKQLEVYGEKAPEGKFAVDIKAISPGHEFASGFAQTPSYGAGVLDAPFIDPERETVLSLANNATQSVDVYINSDGVVKKLSSLKPGAQLSGDFSNMIEALGDNPLNVHEARFISVKKGSSLEEVVSGTADQVGGLTGSLRFNDNNNSESSYQLIKELNNKFYVNVDTLKSNDSAFTVTGLEGSIVVRNPTSESQVWQTTQYDNNGNVAFTNAITVPSNTVYQINTSTIADFERQGTIVIDVKDTLGNTSEGTMIAFNSGNNSTVSSDCDVPTDDNVSKYSKMAARITTNDNAILNVHNPNDVSLTFDFGILNDAGNVVNGRSGITVSPHGTYHNDLVSLLGVTGQTGSLEIQSNQKFVGTVTYNNRSNEQGHQCASTAIMPAVNSADSSIDIYKSTVNASETNRVVLTDTPVSLTFWGEVTGGTDNLRDAKLYFDDEFVLDYLITSGGGSVGLDKTFTTEDLGYHTFRGDWYLNDGNNKIDASKTIKFLVSTGIRGEPTIKYYDGTTITNNDSRLEDNDELTMTGQLTIDCPNVDTIKIYNSDNYTESFTVPVINGIANISGTYHVGTTGTLTPKYELLNNNNIERLLTGTTISNNVKDEKDYDIDTLKGEGYSYNLTKNNIDSLAMMLSRDDIIYMNGTHGTFEQIRDYLRRYVDGDNSNFELVKVLVIDSHGDSIQHNAGGLSLFRRDIEGSTAYETFFSSSEKTIYDLKTFFGLNSQ